MLVSKVRRQCSEEMEDERQGKGRKGRQEEGEGNAGGKERDIGGEKGGRKHVSLTGLHAIDFGPAAFGIVIYGYNGRDGVAGFGGHAEEYLEPQVY